MSIISKDFERFFSHQRMVAQIFVKTNGGRIITLEVNLNTATVKDLKKKIQKYEGIPWPVQRLIFENKQLEDKRLLSDYNVETMSTVHLLLRCAGIAKCIKIDEDDYLKDTFYNYNLTIFSLKYLIHDRICKECEKQEWNKKALCIYKFWTKYTLFYEDKEIADEKIISGLYPHHLFVTFHFKTKKDRLYYLEDKRKIHNKRCCLLTFGFVRNLEDKYELNVPEDINCIIKNVLITMMCT